VCLKFLKNSQKISYGANIYKKLTSLENEVASNIPSLRPLSETLWREKKLTLV
jgi:hypothetical protein